MARANKQPSVAVSTDLAPLQQNALGGGLEGAERTSREMFTWNPQIVSPDRQINHLKDMADARGRDVVQNDGLTTGAVHTHRDSIVGAQFRLIAQPDFEALGATEEWAERFQMIVESRFNLMADSTECWFDASGTMTFTDMIRLGIGGFVYTGEVLQTVEWLNRQRGRPFNTAFQMISPTRLCNPDNSMDTDTLRAGVERDGYGRPTAYHIRTTFPGDFYPMGQTDQWKRVPATTPFGRRMVIHIKDALQPDQTRGIADMVSALKTMKMAKKFNEITLQNAVVNATYAAAVESELPTEAIYQAMGAGGTGLQAMLGQYMDALTAYVGKADNIAVDGVKMPHLFPGTKLSLKPMGTPGGVGTAFEESLLRHIAAPLGLSYEQFSKDYTKTNYSSARASMAETWKFMQSRKKVVAERQATMMYICWLEEEINRPDSVIPLPPNFNFYDPYMREALCCCDWVGASRGQIDESKETEAALARIAGGLSTYQAECARLGEDFRRVFKQRARENTMMEKMGLRFSAQVATEKPDPAEEDGDAPAKDKPKKTEKKK
jgi:lambda family phage portal protein